MARLVVLHDLMLHRYVDLGWRQLKIGRGPQNDIVLDDPKRPCRGFTRRCGAKVMTTC